MTRRSLDPTPRFSSLQVRNLCYVSLEQGSPVRPAGLFGESVNPAELQMNTLLVVADLGGFKAFKLDDNGAHKTPRLEFLEQYDNLEAKNRLVDRVSDLSGRFPRGTGLKGAGAMSDGERHNIQLESRKRLVRQLAQRLNALARTQPVERCFLAASREINHQLLEELDPQLRTKITRNVPADLTKVGRGELLSRF